jgi:hypothetical protein
MTVTGWSWLWRAVAQRQEKGSEGKRRWIGPALRQKKVKREEIVPHGSNKFGGLRNGVQPG